MEKIYLSTFSTKQYSDFKFFFQIKQINKDNGILFDSIIYEKKDYRESNIFLIVYLRESSNRKVLYRSYSEFQLQILED